MGQERLFEGPALAPEYRQGYQLHPGLQLQKELGEKCRRLWRSRDAWPTSPVPLYL